MKWTFHITLLAISLTSCNEDAGWDCLKSYGQHVTETRYLSPFTGLVFYDNLIVTYHQDSVYRVEVSFGDHVIDKVSTEVLAGILRIENTAKCDWVRNLSKKPEVHIYAPSLNDFTNYGAGEFTCADTIRVDTFTYNQWDSNGKVQLLLVCNMANIFNHKGYVELGIAGRSQSASLYSKANGNFSAESFKCKDLSVRNESFQDLNCFASNSIYGEIYQSGNIRYAGNPGSAEFNLIGSGKGIPL